MPQREHQNTQDDSSPDSSSVITSFDELTKGLATGAVSRRKALRWMGSALVGAALASVPAVAWAACPEGQTRCGDRCVNLKTNERHCGSCRNRCRSTQTCCGGRCVNLQTNERHCGSCFNRCAGEGEEGDECVAGVCQGGCPPVACKGGTVNPNTCQCECPPDTVLNNGQCIASAGCTSGTPGCGTCTHPEHGTTDCLCATLADGSGTFCYYGGLCTSSCADCMRVPEWVCVQSQFCPELVACVYPCPNGGPCR